MKDKPHDPRRLDVRRFAATAGHLEGRFEASDLPRLVPDAPLVDGAPARWRLDGEQRAARGAGPQVWLRLRAHASVVLPCQRCLQPMAVGLDVDRAIGFVADEAEAERLDELGEDDVLAWPARGGLDALALVEDELILALPIVPRHEACPQPLVAEAAPAPARPGNEAAAAPDGPVRPHPFAALAALKRPAVAGSADDRPAGHRPGQADGGEAGERGVPPAGRRGRGGAVRR
jgi:uncharacterized protein